jgi:hypothetical protein
MSPRRSCLVALIGFAGCARLVGLDDLRDEQEELQTPAEPGSPGGAAGSSGDPAALLVGVGSAGSGSAGSGSAGSGSAGSGSMGSGSMGSAGGSPVSGDGLPGGAAGAGGGPPDADGPEAGVVPDGFACDVDVDCDDTEPCRTSGCQGGQCVVTGPAAAGTPCGSSLDDECTDPDTCDDQGVCQRNDELAAPCEGGTCTGGQCIPLPPSGCAVDVVSSVPFTASWSSVGRPDLYDGGCDAEGTPEYALVFTAPLTGTFRVTSAALIDAVPYTGAGEASGNPPPPDGDSVMTVVRGNCAGVAAQQFDCNDDVAPGTVNSQLDLELDAGEVVTVYLNELTQTGGGTGTVNISALP